MSEQFKGEKGLAPENLEDQKYSELEAAMAKEDRVMAEIYKVLANTPDRAQAEKIVLEKWSDLMSQAMKKSHEALEAWFEAMRKI